MNDIIEPEAEDEPFIVTPEELHAIVKPYGKSSVIVPVAAAITVHAPAYGLDYVLPLSHFCGQGALESDHFKTLQEYASGDAYEGRKDLGNVMRGDGRRYKGRGIFQLTGRANYARIGKIIGVDLENNPERAAEPELSVLIAMEYWKSRRINPMAERDDCLAVSIAINGRNRKTGMPNHYKERLALTERAKAVFGA